MKRFTVFLLLALSLTAATFAQTKVKSGKDFVTYSYDNWDKAAEDFTKLILDNKFPYLGFEENSNFDKLNLFSLKPNSWNFFIVKQADSRGFNVNFYVSSPEGRQTGLHSYSSSYSSDSNWTEEAIKERLNDLKRIYAFLDEPIP